MTQWKLGVIRKAYRNTPKSGNHLPGLGLISSVLLIGILIRVRMRKGFSWLGINSIGRIMKYFDLRSISFTRMTAIRSGLFVNYTLKFGAKHVRFIHVGF
jgi:hypothetical protein